MKKVVIVLKNLEEVQKVFPTMTDLQIMKLFVSVISEKGNLNKSIGNCNDVKERDKLLDALTDLLEVEEFLAGYLARLVCDVNGFDV